MLDGAMDGPHFVAYMEQILAPPLKKGDIVFMNNVNIHSVDGSCARKWATALISWRA